MNVEIHNSWKSYLQDEFNKPYFTDLVDFVKSEYITIFVTLLKIKFLMHLIAVILKT